MTASTMVPSAAQLVPVVQHPPGGLGGTVADSRRGGTDGGDGEPSQASMIRSDSSKATTSSTARTTIDWNGLRQTGPRPAADAASLATRPS